MTNVEQPVVIEITLTATTTTVTGVTSVTAAETSVTATKTTTTMEAAAFGETASIQIEHRGVKSPGGAWNAHVVRSAP